MTIVRRSIRINHENKKNIRCSPRRSSRSKNSLFGSKYCSYQPLKNKSTNSRKKILSSKRSDERKQKEIQKKDSITIKKEVDANYDIILKVLRSGPIIKEEYDQVKKSMTQCKPTCCSNQVEMMVVDKTPEKKLTTSRQAESFTTAASTMLRRSPRLNKPLIRRSDRLKKYSSEKRQVPRVGRIF